MADSQAQFGEALQRQVILKNGQDGYLADGGDRTETQQISAAIDVGTLDSLRTHNSQQSIKMSLANTGRTGANDPTTTTTTTAAAKTTTTVRAATTPSRSTTASEHWKKRPSEWYPVHSSDFIALPTLRLKQLPRIQYDFSHKQKEPEGGQVRQQRLDVIRHTAKTSWETYKTFAMGHDILRPESATYQDSSVGWGATLISSLDAFWIMGMQDEFEEALRQVEKIDFTTTAVRDDIPVHESVIRYLGGLLGAYDVSGGKYQTLINKAMELAEIVITAFDTPNRMPVPHYHWTS